MLCASAVGNLYALCQCGEEPILCASVVRNLYMLCASVVGNIAADYKIETTQCSK